MIAEADHEVRIFYRDDVGGWYMPYGQPYNSDPAAAMAPLSPTTKHVKESDMKVARGKTTTG